MSSRIEKLASEVGQLLYAQKLTLVTAESCTGGGLSYWITSTPGSSAWFDRGFVTYNNHAKHELLGIPDVILIASGAVSEETVRAMAEGALMHAHAEMSIAITGIAGPSGGTREKPVGTVWLAWSKRNQSHHHEREAPTFTTITEMNVFPGNREDIRKATILRALEKLADILRKKV